MNWRAIFLGGAWLLAAHQASIAAESGNQIGACSKTAADDPKGWKKAFDRVARLPETMELSKALPKNKHVAILDDQAKQIIYNNNCYWDVDVYVDTPERMERWNEFIVPLNGGDIFVLDIVTDEYVTMEEFRKQ